MKLIIFGATGMVGQGVLRAALDAPDVERVLIVVRSHVQSTHPKLKQLVHKTFDDLSGLEEQLKGYDACFYSAGVSSSGISEADYERITYNYTLAAAETLARLNLDMKFIYVSGRGTATTEKGSEMWARVKGRTENALFRLPFKAVFMFRPAYIKPSNGERSQTKSYRMVYQLTSWMFPALKLVFPQLVTSTNELSYAALRMFREDTASRVLESAEIARLGSESR